MKKCTYCGKEYPDEATGCALDAQPLVVVAKSSPPKLPEQSTQPQQEGVPLESQARMADDAESFLGTKSEATVEGAPTTTPSQTVERPLAGLGGVLLLLAGAASLGLTTTDPTNPSVIALSVCIIALGGAASAFLKRYGFAVILTVIVLAACGFVALMSIDPVSRGFQQFTAAGFIVVMLIRGAAGFILSLCALLCLKKRNT